MKTQSAFENILLNNISLLGINESQFELIGENGKIKPGSNRVSESGELHYLDFEYRQALIIEDMPMGSLALLTLLAHKFVKDIHLAEDIAQESFIKAHKSINSFREASAFYTWLYRVTVNTAKNYLNKNIKNN